MRWLRFGLCALAVAGCGGQPAPPGEEAKPTSAIIQDAKAAMARATSYKITLNGTSSTGPTSLQVQADGHGNARGTGTLNGLTVELVFKDGKAYLRGREFWRKVIAQSNGTAAGDAAANLIGDRWVLAPDQSFGDLTARFDSSILADCLDDHGRLTKAGTGTVNGARVIILDDKGDIPGDSPGRLYVAARAPHYPLRITQAGARTAGTPTAHGKCPATADASGSTATDSTVVDLTDFDAKVEVQAPPDPVDLTKLQQP